MSLNCPGSQQTPPIMIYSGSFTLHSTQAESVSVIIAYQVCTYLSQISVMLLCNLCQGALSHLYSTIHGLWVSLGFDCLQWNFSFLLQSPTLINSCSVVILILSPGEVGKCWVLLILHLRSLTSYLFLTHCSHPNETNRDQY
jgi:hypothetical protein